MNKAKLMAVVGLIAFLAAPLYAGGSPELRSDEQIKRDIVDQLAWDNRVNAANIQVAVEGGEVTLSGTVPSHFAQRSAEDDTWSVEGVVALNDLLRVKYPVGANSDRALENRVREVLSYSSAVDAEDISVKAGAGVVTLEGTVDAYWKKLEAEQLAAGVSGVQGVSNEIAVVPTEDVVDRAIAEDVVRAIGRNNGGEAKRVDVRVQNGVVTLTGVVGSWSAHDAAYEAAVDTLGVREVIDELLVELPPGKAGLQSLSDETIRRNVIDQLIWDNRVNAANVTVKVDHGTVTLEGTVQSYLARLAAADTARRIPGVRSVVDELTVSSDAAGLGDRYLEARVIEALDLSPDVDVSDIQVAVQDSVATLKGSVDSAWKAKKAEEIASDVAGVVSVVNELTVVPTKNILDETIARQVVRAIDRNAAVGVNEVTVEVLDGTVTLSGTVHSWLARDAAFNAALNTAGVKAVVNRITVHG